MMDGSFTLGFERGKGAFFQDEKKSRSPSVDPGAAIAKPARSAYR
jgi:hypothetical protein